MFYVSDFPTSFSEIHEIDEKRDDIKVIAETNGDKEVMFIRFIGQFTEVESFPAFDTKEDAAKFIIVSCEQEIKFFQDKIEKLKKEIKPESWSKTPWTKSIRRKIKSEEIKSIKSEEMEEEKLCPYCNSNNVFYIGEKTFRCHECNIEWKKEKISETP